MKAPIGPAPCKICGVETGQRLAWQQHTGFPPHALPQFFEVGVCDDCVSLRPDESGVAVRAALRVLGRSEDRWDAAAPFFNDALGEALSKVLYASQNLADPQAKAWAHVDRGLRRDLRRAYAGVLKARAFEVRRPVLPEAATFRPPVGYRGCGFCGVGESRDWHGPSWTKTLTQGPDLREYVVCDDCVKALQAIGAVGTRAVARAYMTAQGLAYDEEDPPLGLRAWLDTGLPPSAEPWAHAQVHFKERPPNLADALARVAALEAALRGQS
ncbi:hypothetical protein GCM10009798_23360 [Nocardioides panacihumi]|uniref:Uncharacterized protein n=1 Tax=Nocardioides panacihumi TaxID=400774 RepID=A0ABN2R3Z8_9ACTN